MYVLEPNEAHAMNTKAWLILMAIALIGCSDPKNYNLPGKSSMATDSRILEDKIKKPSDKHPILFSDSVTKAVIAEGVGLPAGKATTVRGAITDQNARFKEQEKEQARQHVIRVQAPQNKAEMVNTINSALTTSLVSIGLIGKDFDGKGQSHYFRIRIAIENNCHKDISGFKGTVILKDVFGVTIKTFEVASITRIPAQNTIIYSTDFPYNSRMNEDKKLATLSAETLHYKWIPEAYIYSDGTELIMQN